MDPQVRPSVAARVSQNPASHLSRSHMLPLCPALDSIFQHECATCLAPYQALTFHGRRSSQTSKTESWVSGQAEDCGRDEISFASAEVQMTCRIHQVRGCAIRGMNLTSPAAAQSGGSSRMKVCDSDLADNDVCWSRGLLRQVSRVWGWSSGVRFDPRSPVALCKAMPHQHHHQHTPATKTPAAG
ncbi:hypothetical protein LIA77_07880 [Sarocladium implicatum]|nr:hypothetical protein LIA77_07880 [Sarocladium implicatum]